MRWLLVVLAITAGCNAAFGLDATETIVDDDKDGVSDTVDNCPGLANPDQDDADEDGLGDACDGCDECVPCEHAVDHDEDLDRIDDGCDSCPAVANADQANADGDELGDACDADPQFERRLLFDGFAVLSDDWLQSGTNWVVTDRNDVGPVVNGITATKVLQHGTAQIAAGTRWVFEAGLVTPALDRSALLFVGDTGFCKLEHFANGDWQLTAISTRSAPFAAVFGDTVRLRLVPAGQNTACSIRGLVTVTDPNVKLVYPLSPKLVTNHDGPQFRYVDITAP